MRSGSRPALRTVMVVGADNKVQVRTLTAPRTIGENWLVTARKQNTVVVMMTQFAHQLNASAHGRTLLQALPTKMLLPNKEASVSDYDGLILNQKELEILMGVNPGSRVALLRSDDGSHVIDTDLSALGPLLTILGGMKAGEALVGADYRTRPDFWKGFDDA